MVQATTLHSPTLESVLMVERTIRDSKEECTLTQLWKKLPKKMMYQTFKVIIQYLLDSNKIVMDDKTIVWIHDPEGIKKILAKGVKLR